MAETLTFREEPATLAWAPSFRASPLPPYILHVLPSFGAGEMQRQLAQAINELGRRYRHSIISLDRDTAGREHVDRTLDVALIEHGAEKRKPLAALLACRAALKAEAPDLLITYNGDTLDWALANRLLAFCRHVHVEDGHDAVEMLRAKNLLLRRWALSGAKAVLVPSRKLERIALQQWRVPEARLRLLPDGIDSDFLRAACRAEENLLFAR
jgi:hypothetical protein